MKKGTLKMGIGMSMFWISTMVAESLPFMWCVIVLLVGAVGGLGLVLWGALDEENDE